MCIDRKTLGRLEAVDLRQFWQSESLDFTPWLAKKENLALLANALDIDLAFTAQEKTVGRFCADILCKDTRTNGWVLIENQLECTDHNHLGQLLTYAAGLKAAAIVWIARQFTEEHRAAIDWLNEIANGSAAFYGVQIELWRIDDSSVAPKFNVVCRPNESSRDVRTATDGTTSDTQQYWEGLRDVLLGHQSAVRPRKPSSEKRAWFSVGRTTFWLYADIDRKTHSLEVGVGSDTHRLVRLLKSQQSLVEQETRDPLYWDDESGWIWLKLENVDSADRSDWPSQHRWLAEKLEALHGTFSSRIRELDLSASESADEALSSEQAVLNAGPKGEC
jgi:hypothetical protein